MNKKSRVKNIISNGFSALCSLFIPGFGQLLKGQWGWAAGLYFIPFIVGLIFEWIHIYDYGWIAFIVTILGACVWLFAIFHAYKIPSIKSSKWLLVALFLLIPSANVIVEKQSTLGQFPFVYGVTSADELYHNTSSLNEYEVLIFRRTDKVEKYLRYWIFENSDGKFSIRLSNHSGEGIPVAKPLYIFFSTDFRRMGKRLDDLDENHPKIKSSSL